jgi:hypothetical protein
MAAALACGAVLLALAAGAGNARAGVPQTNSAPAGAQCAGHGSGEFTWNTIWRVDTSGFPGTVGFICLFFGEPEAELLADPELSGARGQCHAYSGAFYTFAVVDGPDPATSTFYSGYGCRWATP